MGFCSSTFRFFVFLFNFIFFLAGCGIIGLGAYMYIKMGDYFDFLGTSEAAVGMSAIIFIVAGVVITIISFMGCCAACTNNACMMYGFSSLMAVILIAEIGVVVAILVYRGKADEIVTTALNNGLQKYGTEDGVKRGWDKGQQALHCCGVNNYTDWKNTTWAGGDDKVPDSCCKQKNLGCGENPGKKLDKIYQKGCYVAFETFIEENIYLVGGAGIGIALFQLLAVIVGCCLGKRMRDNENIGV